MARRAVVVNDDGTLEVPSQTVTRSTPPSTPLAARGGQKAQPKENWTYGEDGLAYPVETGQVWRVGDHVMSCSDLMNSTLFDDLLSASAYQGGPLLGRKVAVGKPTLLFCDPPWGQGLVNSYRTKAGLDKATYRWESLYRRIATFGHDRGLDVWMEGGKRESRDGQKIPDTIAHQSAAVHDYWQIAYYKTNPAGLYYVGRHAAPLALRTPHANPLEGLDDEKVPGVVIGAYEALNIGGDGGVVIDPCMGRGGTSRGAQEHGWRSLGNEMNPRRLSVALSRLHQITGETPEQVA